MSSRDTGLINQEATKRDVDMWMEDLLARIELRIIHPHSVIHQGGTIMGEEPNSREIVVKGLLLDKFMQPQSPHVPDEPHLGLLARSGVRTEERPTPEADGIVDSEIYISRQISPYFDLDAREAPQPGLRLSAERLQEAQTSSDRRRHQRHVIDGGAELRTKGSDTRTWGTLTDVSASGCYVQMYFSPGVRAQLKMTLNVGDVPILAEGIVKVVYPGLGAGIEFTKIMDRDRQRLNELLAARAEFLT